MEHSSGEATFSEPGVPGDLGLLAELGDLGTVAVGLVRPGAGMAVCHTCWLDDKTLSCGQTESTMSDHRLPLLCSLLLSPWVSFARHQPQRPLEGHCPHVGNSRKSHLYQSQGPSVQVAIPPSPTSSHAKTG